MNLPPNGYRVRLIRNGVNMTKTELLKILEDVKDDCVIVVENYDQHNPKTISAIHMPAPGISDNVTLMIP